MAKKLEIDDLSLCPHEIKILFRYCQKDKHPIYRLRLPQKYECLTETPEVGEPGGYQLTLFEPRGADYARHITTGPPHLFGQCGASDLVSTIYGSNVSKNLFEVT